MPNKLILTLDSTQISTWLECNRLWDYGNRQQLTLKIEEPNIAMMIGSYGHKLLEIYYKERCAGKRGAESIALAKKWNPDIETCECGHSNISHIQTVDGPFFCMPSCPCLAFTPKPYPLPLDKRAEVQRRFELYCYTYSDNDFHVTDPRKVEVGFSVVVKETVDRLYILEGRIDLFDVEHPQGNISFVDHKYQMARRDLFEKSIQFRNYGWATKATIGMINYIRMAQKIDKDTFSRKIISYSRAEHKWWEIELIKIYDEVAYSIRDEVFKPNWNSCQGRFNTRCAFTSLCDEINVNVREAKKEQLYSIKKEVWRPW